MTPVSRTDVTHLKWKLSTQTHLLNSEYITKNCDPCIFIQLDDWHFNVEAMPIWKKWNRFSQNRGHASKNFIQNVWLCYRSISGITSKIRSVDEQISPVKPSNNLFPQPKKIIKNAKQFLWKIKAYNLDKFKIFNQFEYHDNLLAFMG